MLHDLQRDFAAALLDDAVNAPLAAIQANGLAPERRLMIYRANVFQSLETVLKSAFPAVLARTGTRLFRKLAGTFIRSAPPTAARLSTYGKAFPDHLARLTPVHGLPELADLARLEWGRIEAYFAADAPVLDPAALQAVAPDALGRLVFRLHPSVRLVAATRPVQDLWATLSHRQATPEPQTPGDRIAGTRPEQPETILLSRPGALVQAHVLEPADAVFMTTIATGGRFERAAAAAASAGSFDLQACLAAHLSLGHFAGFTIEAETSIAMTEQVGDKA